MQFQVLLSAAADCYATQIMLRKYSWYQIGAISECVTPPLILQNDHSHFWPDFISPTLNFDDLIRFQVHSSAPADCYAAVGSSEKYREYEIFFILFY